MEEAWAEFFDVDDDGDLDLLTSGRANPSGDDFGTLLSYVNVNGVFHLSQGQSFISVDDRTDSGTEPSRTTGFVTGMYDSSFATVDIDGEDDVDLTVPGHTRFEIG